MNTCNTCKQKKIRIMLGRYTNNNPIWVDENNKRWYGLQCPSCKLEYGRKLNDNTALSNKNCLYCNKEFKQNNITHKYCSDICYKQSDSYKQIVKEAAKKYNKKIYKPKILQPKSYICITCNNSFKRICKRKVLYCSKLCIPKQKKQLYKSIRKQKVINCIECNKEFKSTHGNNKTCSKLCRNRRSRDCISYKERKRLKKQSKSNKLPKFANLDKITEIYNNCPIGFEVDHIIPLNNPNVTGLHVEFNLQYLSKEDNILKSNKFDGTYDNNSWKI